MRRPRGSVRRLAPALATLTALAVLGGGLPAAQADPTTPAPVPSRAEVDAAAAEADVAAMDLAQVRAELAAAEGEAAETAEAAARAAEAYNGARWRAEEAADAAQTAENRADAAADEAADVREAYAAAMRTGYEQAPTMTALTSVLQADGITSVIERTHALRMAESALDDRARAADAAARSASARGTVAEAKRLEADSAAADAESARDLAQATAEAARVQAADVAARRDDLVARAAQLQGISVALAERRQAGLEARALARAASAEQARQEAAARAAAEQEQREQAGEQTGEQAEPAPPSAPTTPAPVPTAPAPAPAPVPTTPAPAPEPAAPAAPVTPAPSASGGAAAVAFARQQLGEPYVWAAAGPDSWDCSGLTMAAWAAAGRSLPHYSVAQYDASTPVSPADLQPGDLVFWGDSSDPSSIYHVALYAGDDMIIHAPRTGRPVVEESIYYWRLPDFYARP